MGSRDKHPSLGGEHPRTPSPSASGTGRTRIRAVQPSLAKALKQLKTLRRELAQARQQRTATNEVLKLISGSTFDLELVLKILIANATRLCGARQGFVFRPDGDVFYLAADFNAPPMFREWMAARVLRAGDASVVGRVARENRVVQIADAQADIAWRTRNSGAPGISGVRTLLGVPMRRGGDLIGVVAMWRTTVRPFTDKEVRLVETFADQAVIAIENTRLFREIDQKSRQLERASRHKSEFLANMSHELRTPLNAILGFSEILAQGMFGAVNDKQAEYLRDILESGRHLLSLINDILDLSKIEAGRMELELSEFHLPQAIQNALVLVRERAQRRGIGLYDAIDDRLGSIRADERKIKQVMLNLLSNAIKFTPEGGRIEVRAVPAVGHVEMSVTDTGIGIAAEDLEAVFEEFRQVGAADAKAEGTGLGLALSRKFIELHGGRIWATSEPGRGSTFILTLPVP